MNLLFTVLVTFFAGMGAGLGTGFAGMSAAAVISPMLITFLHMDPYMAVGIALSSDVLASAVSAYTYHKNKNLDIKNGLIMMASVLAFTVVGSWVASKMPSGRCPGHSDLIRIDMQLRCQRPHHPQCLVCILARNFAVAVRQPVFHHSSRDAVFGEPFRRLVSVTDR